jgi:hypothetical protein
MRVHVALTEWAAERPISAAITIMQKLSYPEASL